MEKSSTVTLLLLQHFIEDDSGGGVELVVAGQTELPPRAGREDPGQVEEHRERAAQVQPQRVELLHGDLSGGFGRRVIFNYRIYCTWPIMPNVYVKNIDRGLY